MDAPSTDAWQASPEAAVLVPGHAGTWPVPARDRRLSWLIDRYLVYYPLVSGVGTTLLLALTFLIDVGKLPGYFVLLAGFWMTVLVAGMGLVSHAGFWALKWLGSRLGECPSPGPFTSRQLTAGCAMYMGTTVLALFAGLGTLLSGLLAAIMFSLSGLMGTAQAALTLFIAGKTVTLWRFRVRALDPGVEMTSGLTSTITIPWEDLVLMERPSRPVVMDESGRPRTWLFLYSRRTGQCLRLPLTFKGREQLREKIVERLARQGRYLSPFPDQILRIDMESFPP